MRAVEAAAALPPGEVRTRALADLNQLHPRDLSDLSSKALEALREEHPTDQLDRLAGALSLPGGAEEALRILAAARMNAFGCGWYFMTDMFNHSCQPKCFKSVPRGAGGDSLLRTLRAVFPGEELTLDYLGDWAVPADRASRRSRLQRQFDFECACVLCAGTEGGRMAPLEAASGEPGAARGILEALRSFGDSAEACLFPQPSMSPADCEALLADALGLLLSSRAAGVGPRHLLVARTQALCARACAALPAAPPRSAPLEALARETLGLVSGSGCDWVLLLLGLRLWALAELRETQRLLHGDGDAANPRTLEALAELSDALGRLHTLGPRAWAALLGAASFKGPRALFSCGAGGCSPGRLQAECHRALAWEARRGREGGEGAGREGAAVLGKRNES